VRGIFSFRESKFRDLCKCINVVASGQVWANTVQLQQLLDLVVHVPTLRVANIDGKNLLTPREEQVVALVADGMSNREVALELGLREHTIKTYLFRIFEKLGISRRVELVLFAMNHGYNQPAEWMAGGFEPTSSSRSERLGSSIPPTAHWGWTLLCFCVASPMT